MKRIALTGGIATGKSYVLSRLRDLGIPTIDADDIVREALASATPTARAIEVEFGSDVTKPRGGIDHQALAGRVFNDPEARLRLEAIVHPFVYARINEWLASADGLFAVASIPLLYETHHEHDFDMVVVTACSAEQQMERLLARGMSEKDARGRMAAQIPAHEKARRADFVIWTTGTKAETDAQVDKLLAQLTSD